MEKLNLESYRKVNASFRKRMMYRVGVDCGFFVELNYMVNAMLYCLAHRIRFQLYSEDANFGTGTGWTEYFLPLLRGSAREIPPEVQFSQVAVLARHTETLLQAEILMRYCLESKGQHEKHNGQTDSSLDIQRSNISITGRFYGRDAEVMHTRTWHRYRLYERIRHGGTYGLAV